VVEEMPVQLTASLLVEDQDFDLAHTFVPILERKSGRIVFNGYPTGVEVSHAMVHGGPFPATSDSRTTSVGAGAIERFLRPVSYQNMPHALLPESLRDTNPMKIVRLQDAKLELG
jgi:NADP-dependent aldehyde dehydrogenase